MEVFTCHDLQARPAYHHKHDSIVAHVTIAFAGLPVSCWIVQATGWSIPGSSALPRYRTPGRAGSVAAAGADRGQSSALW